MFYLLFGREMVESRPGQSEARERVLEAAARLFAQRGYTAVTLRDIAADVGIRHTSLYHHVPGGKEQLFVEVTERTLQQHRLGLTHALADAGLDVRAQLRAAADWLLDHPPMDLVRMMYSDMPTIDRAESARLSQLAFDALLAPVAAALERAVVAGALAPRDMDLIAGGLIGMFESLHAVPLQETGAAADQRRRSMAYELIDAFLDGLSRS